MVRGMTTDMKENEYLEPLGFSQNEAKVYTTLLKHKMLNGYEIAKLSGVSRSLVYDVINRLVGRGILFRLEGEPNYYKPLEYRELTERIRRENESNMSRAEKYLESLACGEENHDYVLNIMGVDKSVKKAVELIEAAEEEISLSLWRMEFDLLRDALEKALERGVKVYLFTFEEVELDGAVVFSYRICDAQKLFPYRRMTLVADGVQCLTGENSGERSIFTCTRNHAIVSLATDEIVLNIFWYKYMEKRGLLCQRNTSGKFLRTLAALAQELDISDDMTKNFIVYDYQRRGGNEREER